MNTLDSKLIDQSEKGDILSVKSLLEEGANPNAVEENDGYILHGAPLLKAAEEGHTDIVKILLDYGANPDAFETSDGIITVRILTKASGHLEIVKLLLSAGPDIDTSYALRFASVMGHNETIKLLLARQDITQQHKDQALTESVVAGRTNAVKLLLTAGARANDKALPFSSEKGNLEIVQLLLNEETVKNKDISLRNAVEKGYDEITRLLLNAGAVPTGKELNTAVLRGYTYIVGQLLKAGLVPGKNDLIEANIRGHVEISKLLIQAGSGSMKVYLEAKRDSKTAYEYVVVPKGYIVYKGQPEDCAFISSGWLTEEREVASTYSENVCCYVFEKECRLFYMSDENITRMQENYENNRDKNVWMKKDKEYNMSIFDLIKKAFSTDRTSYKENDMKILRVLCWWFFEEYGYDGYYAPERTQKSSSYFHREIALCDPQKILTLCTVKKTGEESVSESTKDDSVLRGDFVKLRPRVIDGTGWDYILPQCKSAPLTKEEMMSMNPDFVDEDYDDYLRHYSEFCEY
jgi:ankyrin repeat protein